MARALELGLLERLHAGTLDCLAMKKRAFSLFLTADFLIPTVASNSNTQTAPVLDIIPLRSDAAWGTFTAKMWNYTSPVYHRLAQTQLENVHLVMRHPITGAPVDIQRPPARSPTGSWLRLRF